jgi:mannose-6-phosphate isomerase-like protein (cupin superfamily)
MKRSVVLVGLLALAVGLVAVAHASTSLITVRSAMEQQFKEIRPGFHATTLWGDRDRGAWGGVARADPGNTEAWHTHSSPLRLVVISGALTVEGGDPSASPVGPGGYVEIPANVRHRAVCGYQEPCVFVMTQASRYDRLPDGSASGRPGMDAAEEEAARFQREVWEAP